MLSKKEGMEKLDTEEKSGTGKKVIHQEEENEDLFRQVKEITVKKIRKKRPKLYELLTT